MCDVVLFVERSGEFMYVARLRYRSTEAEGKPIVKSALSCMPVKRLEAVEGICQSIGRAVF